MVNSEDMGTVIFFSFKHSIPTALQNWPEISESLFKFQVLFFSKPQADESTCPLVPPPQGSCWDIVPAAKSE